MIVRLDNLARFDELISLASEEEIYDLVKVDYRNEDIPSIYREIYEASIKLVNDKKERYLQTNSRKTYPAQRIVADNFYSIYPNSQYKKYQAYETSDLSAFSKRYSDDYLKKEVRKATTFFYDGAEISGVDQILNADDPVVGIQYFLELSVIYELVE